MTRTWIYALLLLLLATEGWASDGCDGAYACGIEAYRAGDMEAAEEGFRGVVEEGAERPETLKAEWFLIRVLMATDRNEEAMSRLISLYRRSPLFFRLWSGDHLLGECRARLGLDEPEE